MKRFIKWLWAESKKDYRILITGKEELYRLDKIFMKNTPLSVYIPVGFYKTKEEAETALQRAKDEKSPAV